MLTSERILSSILGTGLTMNSNSISRSTDGSAPLATSICQCYGDLRNIIQMFCSILMSAGGGLSRDSVKSLSVSGVIPLQLQICLKWRDGVVLWSHPGVMMSADHISHTSVALLQKCPIMGANLPRDEAQWQKLERWHCHHTELLWILHLRNGVAASQRIFASCETSSVQPPRRSHLIGSHLHLRVCSQWIVISFWSSKVHSGRSSAEMDTMWWPQGGEDISPGSFKEIYMAYQFQAICSPGSVFNGDAISK